MIKLYSYFRSTASYRVRIALALKGLNYDYIPVHLLNNGGEQYTDDYKGKNPQSLVPTFIDDNITLTQSMAIIEYLDENHPNPSLLSDNIEKRAFIRQISNIIACDVHPLNNLKVLTHLTGDLSVTQQQKNDWYFKWIEQGFTAIERLLENSPFRTEQFCCGNTVSMADIFLIAQIYNARRFNCPMNDYPIILEIEKHCLSLDAFIKAIPENQIDAS